MSQSSCYLKQGSMFRVTSKEAMDIHEKLPAANYVVGRDDHGYFLARIDSFEINTKLYGNVGKHTKRILKTFDARTTSTGVLLSGEKGSGKSLLAKNISIEAAKLDIPTLVINHAHFGDGFNSLIQNIIQPAVVLFDEFEKVYDKEEQQAMLTLLDGVFSSKKLFVLTCNDKSRIDQNMRNRPGRIFYALDYTGIDAAFIREYSQDNLNDKNHVNKVVQVATTFDNFNIDMLKALIEEMNRFDETVIEALGMLNAKPEFGGKNSYSVVLSINNKIVPKSNMYDKTDYLYSNPLVESFFFNYKVKVKDAAADANDDDDLDVEEEGWRWQKAIFSPQHLKHVDDTGMILTFISDRGVTATLTKNVYKQTNYLDNF
jgi:hypothetical protein